jgi:quinol monooxygenase YgiN
VIIVTGSIHGRPETMARIETLSLEHVRRSRQEPGCLLHSVQRDIENPLHLVFLEQWRDADALRTHFRVAASRSFVSEVETLAAQPPEISIFSAEVATL